MKFYKEHFQNKKYFNSENLAKCCVSLPIDPMLTSREVNKIINIINKF